MIARTPRRERFSWLVGLLVVCVLAGCPNVSAESAPDPLTPQVFRTARFETSVTPRPASRSRIERKSAAPGFVVDSSEKVYGEAHRHEALIEVEIREAGGELVVAVTPLSREDVTVEGVSGGCATGATILAVPRLIPSNAISGIDLMRIVAKPRRCELEIRVGDGVATFDMDVRERDLGGPPK